MLLLFLTQLNIILTMSKKTLVFGASLKPERYSNMAIRKLTDFGYDTVAFGSQEGVQYGVFIDSRLQQYYDIDTISLYLNAYKQKQYYEYFVSLRPKRIIFNPGTENPDLYRVLKVNNIEFEVACTLVLLSTDQY